MTYLFSPLTLYYSLFIWLNPAPFIFFFFSGFYMLIKGRKHTGTILIVCAALFKQTAWFLGLPLVTYLLIRPQGRISDGEDSKETNDPPKKKTDILTFLRNYFDLPGFFKSTILVVSFVLAIFLPYLIITPWFLNNLALAAGSFALESFTELPGYGSPIRFQVLPVAAGLPEVARILDTIVFYGFFLTFGVMVFLGLMLLEKRLADKPIYYMRRLLFLTMLLMLWVHLMGPRGVYKYYFALFAPFFSIFSSEKMIRSEDDTVPFSYSMIYLPALLSLAIILPNRSIYLFPVLLIFICFIMAEQIGAFWFVVTKPLRWCKGVISGRLKPVKDRLAHIRETRGPTQSRTFSIGTHILSIRFVGVLDQLFRREKLLLSQLYMDGELLSQNSSPTWTDDDEGLSAITHHLTLPEGDELIINHRSSIVLSMRVLLNGEEIRV